MLTDQSSRSHGNSTTLMGYWSSAVPTEIPNGLCFSFFQGWKKADSKIQTESPPAKLAKQFWKRRKKSHDSKVQASMTNGIESRGQK